ncbi:hypothetical protein WMO40_13120 [Bacillaceae bacterium CLA-AA-H227]|uniref:HTH cro/C1-type domain-containing protein n=2 Tax=Robertmurraya TaxID=2837507 RepID=A0A4U1D048_9BACI|nr:hypothetical protein [Robertmurraya kyonggiensis]TKC15033.1 hypothetical protein FA727_19245 [Robertmurraya kyonggiensis]
MAKFIQIPETTLRYWTKGINLIPLPSLIKICLQLNISILELFGIEELPINIQLPQKDLSKNSPKLRNKFDHKIIKRILDNEIISEHSKSLKKVAEIIGYDRKLLYKKFPIECKKIVDNYQSYITEQKLRRENNIKKQLDNIAQQLSENGEYPSRRKVEKLLKQKYFVKEKNIREQWNSLKINYLKI